MPVQFFKIVYDPKLDYAVGFVLPNVKIGSTIANLQTYVKPIADIETETGLNFFGSWTFRHQTVARAQRGHRLGPHRRLRDRRQGLSSRASLRR
ncbi:MAG: hypothetical protein WDN44_12220 [Sphingomonas sp.]